MYFELKCLEREQMVLAYDVSGLNMYYSIFPVVLWPGEPLFSSSTDAVLVLCVEGILLI